MTRRQGGAVMEPGPFFRLTAGLSPVGGGITLMWLGEPIAARGVSSAVLLITMLAHQYEGPTRNSGLGGRDR